MMKYNVWIYNCDSIFELDDVDSSVIRLESIDQDTFELLAETFGAQGINICAFPIYEG